MVGTNLPNHEQDKIVEKVKINQKKKRFYLELNIIKLKRNE